MKAISSLFIALIVLNLGLIQGQNNRPIIGIFTQPTDTSLCGFGDQYIAASYVKFVESGGARVVPIFYDSDQETLQALFNSINGILLPGGGVDFDSYPVYTENLQYLWDLAIQANDNGDVFPIWGTCMGFQELNCLAVRNFSILTSGFNSENYTVPLTYTPNYLDSKIFGDAPSEIVENLGSLPITMNNHQAGVTPDQFKATPDLYNFFNVLSTNVDRDGNPFLSTIEAINYPIFGTQWHPEKPLFEWWAEEVMNHSFESVLANQYTSNFFVNQCRQSMHTFPTQQAEFDALIYNYQPVYTFNNEPDFEQSYCFNSASSSSN